MYCIVLDGVGVVLSQTKIKRPRISVLTIFFDVYDKHRLVLSQTKIKRARISVLMIKSDVSDKHRFIRSLLLNCALNDFHGLFE